MLTPEQLDRYPEALIQLWAEVELDIIVDIARRILKTNFLTPTAKWQYQKVKEMRQLEEYILQRLSALTKKTHAELKQLFEDAAVKTVESDNEIYEAAGITPKVLEDSPALKTVVEEGLKQTEGLYKNLTGTIADTVTKQFEDALDHAYLQVVSGAFTPQQAIRGAVKALAAAGMQSITYPSGHRDHMDVAIRRATLTGINQTCARVQLRHAEEMGCDLVQVTSHLGARPTHAVWQGGIFSRSGKHPKYPDFVSTTGYGTGAGLCGWNCHHNFFPFFEGISVDTYKRYDVEENNRVYAQSQKQRAFERKIRKDKRECAAFDKTGQKDDFNRSAAKLKKHEEELKEFLKTTNLYRRRDREQVLEFGRSQSSKAAWVGRKMNRFRELSGLKTDNGLNITGVSKHFGERAIQRKVEFADVKDALTSPLKVGKIKKGSNGKQSQEFIGASARVQVNPDTGNLITVWKTGTKLRTKLGKDEKK